MQKKIIVSIATFCLTSLFSLVSNASTTVNTSLAPMLEKVVPSVVNVRAQMRPVDYTALARQQNAEKEKKPEANNTPNNQDSLPSDNKLMSIGSGVIIDAEKGYIITNSHVIEDAETVTITLGDSRHYTAKVIGFDKPSDVALLQIQAKNLTAISMANSNNLKVGDFVAAIGNPFGLNQSVSSGIVSALGRTTLGIENFENFIQTDATINPGNSGGALVNTQGELIGINTAILAPDRGSIGIGFAIPSNMVKSITQQLIQYGNVRRGALGIGAQDLTPELANAFNQANQHGAVVSQVISKTPAEKAGLKIGDIITAVNSAKVSNANDVINTIGFLRVDSTIKIDIIRNGKTMQLTATLNDPKQRKESGQTSDPFFYGVGLKHFKLSSPVYGNLEAVLVVSVDEDSNAWHSDLRPGDVITMANQQKVTTVDELKKIAADNDSKKRLLVNVMRGQGAVFLIISGDA